MFFQKKALLATFFLVSLSSVVQAQLTKTVTITTGSGWIDVLLLKSTLASEASFANTNYNVYPRIMAASWPHSNADATYRTLLRFDLTVIPTDAIVESATLKFKKDPGAPPGEFGGIGGGACEIRKITQAWNATTVTWNTQPTNTQSGNITFSQSGDASVSVKSFVQSMVSSPSTNYGLLFKSSVEGGLKSISYVSTDHPDASLHPQLVITYTYAPPVYWCIQDGDWNDAIWSTEENGTTGSVLPDAYAAVNIKGHSVDLKKTAKVYSAFIGSANGLPGILTVDGGELTTLSTLDVSTDNGGNKVEILNQGAVSVSAAQ